MGSIEWAGGTALVRAEVRLLSTAEGGKRVPIRESYRPNHNFFGAENLDMAMGFIDFASGDQMKPGETRVLEINFLSWPASALQPGREWRIQEGLQLVGIGRILDVLAKSEGLSPP
ncbi:MAG: hypothetical protein JSS35_15990 [Proteobacteria bacterium]|nr:hypothetical protein [Pseudomonadota bacterium]